MRPTHYSHWTTTKLARLREIYQTATWEQLEREFGHPRESIRNTANRILKLKRPRRGRDWESIANKHLGERA
jgi:hypothetical protein